MPQAEFEKYWPYDPLYMTRVALSCRDADDLPRVENAGGFEKLENGMEVQIMHNGIRILKDAYRGKMVTDMTHFLRGVHEPQEEKVFAEVLPYVPRGGTMVEFGSNWAFYSLWFNKDVPDAKNFCIEPDLNSLQVGINNFMLNNAFAIFLQAGVKCTTNQDYAQPTFGKNHILMPFHGAFDGNGKTRGPRRAIRTINVDELMNEFEIPFIDLLHIDIQLAEIDLLKNSPKSFTDKKVGYVFVSTHNTPDWLAPQIIELV